MNVRRPTQDDLGAVAELLLEADLADTGAADWGEVTLADHWRTLDLSQDAWLIELAGNLAGYADFDDRGAGRVVCDGYVRPALRGRGVGSELLRLTEGRAVEAVPAGRLYVHNATVADAAPLFSTHGYAPVRRSLRMAIDLDRELKPDPPAGIEIRPLRPGEERAMHAVLEEAFSDHWEHRRRSFDEYAERTFARPDFDAGLCFVAVHGEEYAGASLNFWKEQGDWGWIGSIGVRPAWRRRGIAQALMHASFGEFFRRGERRVALGVDAQSETGAVRLYERLGMRTLWEAVVYEKELRAA